MTRLEKATKEYREAGMALDFFSVVGGSKEEEEKAKERYRKAAQEFRKVLREEND